MGAVCKTGSYCIPPSKTTSKIESQVDFGKRKPHLITELHKTGLDIWGSTETRIIPGHGDPEWAMVTLNCSPMMT